MRGCCRQIAESFGSKVKAMSLWMQRKDSDGKTHIDVIPFAPIVVVAFAGVLIAVLLPIMSTVREARRSADSSAQRALFTEAKQLLQQYRAEHGQYPKALDQIAFTFPDGGDQRTVTLFDYKSNGETYSLVTKDVYSGEALRAAK
jgi:hypothetical protein